MAKPLRCIIFLNLKKKPFFVINFCTAPYDNPDGSSADREKKPTAGKHRRKKRSTDEPTVLSLNQDP